PPAALDVPLADRQGACLPSRRGGFDSHRALWFRNQVSGDGSQPEEPVFGCLLIPGPWLLVFGDRLVVGFLALNQETKVRTLLPELFFGNRLAAKPPGSEPGDEGATPSSRALDTQIRQPAERRGLNPRGCGFDSHSGYTIFVSVEQPGVLACLSRR